MKSEHKALIFVSILLFVLLLSTVSLAREEDEEPQDGGPGIPEQFADSFWCLITECGWPAIVILILPAIAIYVWKKFFSWG